MCVVIRCGVLCNKLCCFPKACLWSVCVYGRLHVSRLEISGCISVRGFVIFLIHASSNWHWHGTVLEDAASMFPETSDFTLGFGFRRSSQNARSKASYAPWRHIGPVILCGSSKLKLLHAKWNSRSQDGPALTSRGQWSTGRSWPSSKQLCVTTSSSSWITPFMIRINVHSSLLLLLFHLHWAYFGKWEAQNYAICICVF